MPSKPAAVSPDLLPDEDFRFRMTMWPGDPGRYLRPMDPAGVLLPERRRWLKDDAQRHARLEPEGRALFEEMRERAPVWNLPPVSGIVELGALWEPDIVLFVAGDDGRFRVRGGAVVFPSGWALEEKLGQTVDAIHAVVPGLNSTIGPAIDRFLAALAPENARFRANWGIAATAELNAHPARGLPAPALPVALDRLWLRVEHQMLLRLPRTGGIVFGIRIDLQRLDEFVRVPGAASRLRRALSTMPAEVAAYKRLDGIALPLAEVLSGTKTENPGKESGTQRG